MEALNSVNIISGLGGIRKQKIIKNVKGEGVTSILDQVRFPRSPGMKES